VQSRIILLHRADGSSGGTKKGTYVIWARDWLLSISNLASERALLAGARMGKDQKKQRPTAKVLATEMEHKRLEISTIEEQASSARLRQNLEEKRVGTSHSYSP